MAVKTFTKTANGEENITANFKIKEFACKDGSNTILIDVDFVKNYLQKIRDFYGKAVIIISAYRTPQWNRKGRTILVVRPYNITHYLVLDLVITISILRHLA